MTFGVRSEQGARRGDDGEEGRAGVGGVIAGLILIAAVALVVVVLFGGGDGHRYTLLFSNGGQLVPGNQVLVGGQPVGTVDEITLTDDAQAAVEVTLDEPLHEGSRAVIRATSLSGIANRYIALHPGPDSEPEIPEGETISGAQTTAPVDLDQLFNTFDRRTRAALRDFIQGQATVYTGNNEAARETYRYFAPSLQAGERLFAELTRDEPALNRFLVSGARVLGAVAERRDDLAALTENGNQALGAIAARNAELDRALGALPPTMRQANTTFVNLRAALDDLDPLVADAKRAAPELPGFLRDLRPVARDAVPVLANLRRALSRPGGRNDLADALADLAPAERSARRAVPRAVAALRDSEHIFAFARPYSPDLLALAGKLGAATGYYDFSGHYVRAQPTGSNPFAYDAATQRLEPIPLGSIYNAYAAFGLGPLTRCPGGSTQPNPGWPTPTDHPFLDHGGLTGECDPADVPPGP